MRVAIDPWNSGKKDTKEEIRIKKGEEMEIDPAEISPRHPRYENRGIKKRRIKQEKEKGKKKNTPAKQKEK